MILFLDFDGVTHAEPYTPASAFEKLHLIEAVVREVGCVQIVISSSWREDHTLDELRCVFSQDLRQLVAGVTPDLWNPEQPIPHLREAECRAWLADHQPHMDWMAIDDRPKWFAPHCQKLLVTDTTQGFLQSQQGQLRRMLGGMGQRPM